MGETNSTEGFAMDTSGAAAELAHGRWSGTTPEDRRRATMPAPIAHAVKTIVEDWPELTDDQVQRLRLILAQAGGGHDG